MISGGSSVQPIQAVYAKALWQREHGELRDERRLEGMSGEIGREITV